MKSRGRLAGPLHHRCKGFLSQERSTMRYLPLAVAIALFGCAQNPIPTPVPVEQDESIVFPDSLGPAPVVGRPGKPYALEGAILQALMIATNDFLPPISKDTPCWGRRDAYVYQVLRQENVIFIEIHADPAACDGRFLMLDSGMRYAISVDGRILRRLQTGEPEWPARVSPSSADAGASDGTRDGGMREPDLSGIVEVPHGTSPAREPWMRGDGGTGPDAPESPSPVVVDGGTSTDGGAPVLPR